MFIIELAGVKIRINNLYPYIKKQCVDYIIESELYDFAVDSSEADIKKENLDNSPEFSSGYLESLSVYRKICSALPAYDAYLIHGAVIEYEGKAYAFLAKSGVGKSTHIRLWRELLGDKVGIINGDKPIIRIHDGAPYAYGTPWAGKEGWQKNTSAPLAALVFIARSETNSITELSARDALLPFISQCFIPNNENKLKTLDLIDTTLSQTTPYSLYCTNSLPAATLSFIALTSPKH